MGNLCCPPTQTETDDREDVPLVDDNVEQTLKLILPIKNDYERIGFCRYSSTRSLIQLDHSLFLIDEKFNTDGSLSGTFVYNVNINAYPTGCWQPTFVLEGTTVEQSVRTILLLYLGNKTVTTKQFTVAGEQPVGLMDDGIRPIKAEMLFINNAQSSYRWLDKIHSVNRCEIILPSSDITMFKHPAFRSLTQVSITPEHEDLHSLAVARIPVKHVNYGGVVIPRTIYADWNRRLLYVKKAIHRQISIALTPMMQETETREILRMTGARKTKVGEFYCVTVPFTTRKDLEFNVGFFSNHVVIAIIAKGKAENFNWRTPKDFYETPEWPIARFDTEYNNEWVQFEDEVDKKEETGEERLARYKHLVWMLQLATISQEPHPADPFQP